MSTLKKTKSSLGYKLAALGATLTLTLAPTAVMAQEEYTPGPETTIIIVDEVAGQNVTTASQINGMEMGQDVLLRGNIMEHRGGDNYLFEDMSGTATVIISKADMQKLQVRAKNQFELTGKVVQDGSGMAVKVTKMVKLR